MTEPQVTPEMYARVFDSHHEGRLILEDLVKRFAGNPYVKGGQEADRETCYRAGQARVPNFILLQINVANGVSDGPEQLEYQQR